MKVYFFSRRTYETIFSFELLELITFRTVETGFTRAQIGLLLRAQS